jgi:hypothetical protein
MRIAYFYVAAACAATPVAAQVIAQAVSPPGANSALSGVVVDTVGHPVQYAQVVVVNGTAGTTADEDGRFHVAGLSAGRNVFEVRRIGFEPVYFEVALRDSVDVQVRVSMHANVRALTTVEVDEVREPLKRVGFYDRMAQGNGHFISPEMLAKMRPLRATDALMNIPNVAIDRRGNKSRVMTANMRCEYGIVIDKVLVGEAGSRIRTTYPDDLVSASDLYAIEVYPRNRGLPLQFLGMSHEDGCGTIVIWTKQMLPR